MSAAAPTATTGPAPIKSGKKKLILITAITLVLALVTGGGVALFLKNKAAHARADGDEEGMATAQVGRIDLKHPPTFLPLDPFVVNLADRDTDRYAQIGITLEVEAPEFAEEMKAYMPAVRNTILLILSHKTAAELQGREGKEALADEIMRESVRPMGIEIDPPSVASKKEAKGDGDEDGDDDDKPRRKARRAAVHNPVRAVNFSNFIIQ